MFHRSLGYKAACVVSLVASLVCVQLHCYMLGQTVSVSFPLFQLKRKPREFVSSTFFKADCLGYFHSCSGTCCLASASDFFIHSGLQASQIRLFTSSVAFMQNFTFPLNVEENLTQR